ncbi:hypothetical protein TNCV_1938361 [Trichonephila clavipes]|nr:hypothetical protein TNCV_1938361 [Trichonephila clavipes]
MATGSYLTPTYSRSQSEVQGDLHRMMTKSVVSVAVIVGYNRCLMSRHGIEEASDVSLKYSSPCGFPILPKLIWCSSDWYILDQ